MFALESIRVYLTYVPTSVFRRPLAELPGGRSLHKKGARHRKTAVCCMDRQGGICGHSHPARHSQVKNKLMRDALLYCSFRYSDRVCVSMFPEYQPTMTQQQSVVFLFFSEYIYIYIYMYRLNGTFSGGGGVFFR